VAVHVDEARRDDKTSGIYGQTSFVRMDGTDLGDLTTLDTHIRSEGGPPRTINH
jgi:hypothetical protein